MTWQTGSANTYKELLDDLVNIATSNHVDSAAISAAGTGYVVGDIITASGGTFFFAATFEVLTVGGSGDITSLRIKTGGAYTVNPSSPVSTTGGTGTGATVTVTFAATGWTALRETSEAVSATVAAGGTGYTVGDDLTLVGGNFTTAAVFNVDSVSGGVVTAVSLVTAGDYRDIPSNPVSTTGGTGTGATLNVTFGQSTGSQEKEVILQGADADSPTVGIKTYQVVVGFDTAFNWTLAGMTGFNANLDFEAQPGVMPTGPVPTSAGGAYVPLKGAAGGFPLDFWFSMTDRYIKGVVRTEDAIVTHYQSFYIGFGNPFGTNAEFPYPIYIQGSSSRHDALFDTTLPSLTGLTEVVGIAGKTGPGWYRRSDNVWQEVKNSSANDVSISRVASNNYTVYPCGIANVGLQPVEDEVVAPGGFDWQDIIPNTGIPGTETLKLRETTDSGPDIRVLIPTCLIASDNTDFEVVMELDGVFWVSADGVVISGDTVTIGTAVYSVFQNGNRTTDFSFMAIRED